MERIGVAAENSMEGSRIKVMVVDYMRNTAARSGMNITEGKLVSMSL
jgi:hypothetical protein